MLTNRAYCSFADGSAVSLSDHWVSEFAPPRFQRVLSYISGWLATLSWQAANASGPFLCASIIQSMIALRDPSYGWAAWQTWLLAVACCVLVTAFNVFAERWLPLMQNVDAVIYVALWIATIVALAATGPHVDARDALLDFQDLGNWPTVGFAVIVGQISAVFALGGSDAAVRVFSLCKRILD
jgi:choline transport protein